MGAEGLVHSGRALNKARAVGAAGHLDEGIDMGPGLEVGSAKPLKKAHNPNAHPYVDQVPKQVLQELPFGRGLGFHVFVHLESGNHRQTLGQLKALLWEQDPRKKKQEQLTYLGSGP